MVGNVDGSERPHNKHRKLLGKFMIYSTCMRKHFSVVLLGETSKQCVIDHVLTVRQVAAVLLYQSSTAKIKMFSFLCNRSLQFR